MTKAEGDKLVQRMIYEDDLPAAIVRPEAMFGPNDRSTSGDWPIGCAREGDHHRLRAQRRAVRVRGRRGAGIAARARASPCLEQAYNITNDQRMTAEEFLGAIADEVGGKVPPNPCAYRALYGAAAVAEWIATLTKREPLVTRHGVQMFGSGQPAVDRQGPQGARV